MLPEATCSICGTSETLFGRKLVECKGLGLTFCTTCISRWGMDRHLTHAHGTLLKGLIG